MVRIKKTIGVVFAVGLLFILSSGYASALGIIGNSKITVVYEPGVTKTFEYTLVPDGNAQKYQIYPEGALAKYVTIAPEMLDFKSVSSGQFSTTVSFPETNMEPGLHTITIVVKAVADDATGTVSASVAVTPVILLKALFEGKKINLDFEFSKNVRMDKKAGINIAVDGWGVEMVDDLDAEVEIYDSLGRVVDTVSFDSVSLEPGASYTFSKEWSPRDAGIQLLRDSEDFKAVAIVSYDGETETANKDFTVTTDLMVLKEKPSYTLFVMVIALLVIAFIGLFIYVLKTRRRKSDD
tara:strand:+ start:181 stop:1065 length:885 start_codon:yes stop_codon:yes gene_type:complete